MTRKYKRLSLLFNTLSILSVVAPLIVFIIIGYSTGVPAKKVTMSLMIVLSLFLCGMNVVFKLGFRSTIWIILIGLCGVLEKVELTIIILGICSLADELCFSPLHRHYKNKYTINKEIDKRTN